MYINDSHILTLLKVYTGQIKLNQDQKDKAFKVLVSHIIHSVILNDQDDSEKYLRSFKYFLKRIHQIVNNTDYDHDKIIDRCEKLIQELESRATVDDISEHDDCNDI